MHLNFYHINSNLPYNGWNILTIYAKGNFFLVKVGIEFNRWLHEIFKKLSNEPDNGKPWKDINLYKTTTEIDGERLEMTQLHHENQHNF